MTHPDVYVYKPRINEALERTLNCCKD